MNHRCPLVLELYMSKDLYEYIPVMMYTLGSGPQPIFSSPGLRQDSPVAIKLYLTDKKNLQGRHGPAQTRSKK